MGRGKEKDRERQRERGGEREKGRILALAQMLGNGEKIVKSGYSILVFHLSKLKLQESVRSPFVQRNHETLQIQ